MEKIGAIIRKHRVAKGLTQEELGNKVFVSKQAVSKWETGKTVPDIETVRKLCDILEINKDEILGTSMKEAKKSHKLFHVFAALSAISFVVRPGTALASCTITGTPIALPAAIAG